MYDAVGVAVEAARAHGMAVLYVSAMDVERGREAAAGAVELRGLDWAQDLLKVDGPWVRPA